MTVEIAVEGDQIVLRSPYHPELPAAAKRIGGRFHRADKSWRFDPRDESEVRAVAWEIFGTDGENTETVSVRYTLNRDDVSERTLYLCGREIAWRPGRDDDVRLGDGVVIREGGFPGYGGSRQYPVLAAEMGTVLEIRDLPAGHKDLERDGVEVIEKTVDREALMAERDRLSARIQEIDRLLDAALGE